MYARKIREQEDRTFNGKGNVSKGIMDAMDAVPIAESTNQYRTKPHDK